MATTTQSGLTSWSQGRPGGCGGEKGWEEIRRTNPPEKGNPALGVQPEVGMCCREGAPVTFSPSGCPGRPASAPNYPAAGGRREELFSAIALPYLYDLPEGVISVASCLLGTLFPVMSSGSLLASGLLTPCKNNFPSDSHPLPHPPAMLLDLDWLRGGEATEYTESTSWTENASGPA